MAAKFVVVLAALALVATAYGSLVSVIPNQDSSSFSYDVADPYTGDYKSQTEVRDGDFVRGQYSLLDPDGTYRIVDYTADDLNGFNAVVRKEPVAAASAVVESPVVTDAIVEASPVIAARTISPAAAPLYHQATPAIVATKTIATPVVAAKSYATPLVAAKTYTAPVIGSEAYASPAFIAKTYAPSIYANAIPTISRSYASPSLVATNEYSSPLVYSEPSLYSSDYYRGSYLSPYYSAYGINGVPVDALGYYKK